MLADVSDFAQVESVVARTVERFGRLDVLISNAGVLSPNGRIHNLATEDWERAFRVNSSVPSTAFVPRWPSCAPSARARSS